MNYIVENDSFASPFLFYISLLFVFIWFHFPLFLLTFLNYQFHILLIIYSFLSFCTSFSTLHFSFLTFPLFAVSNLCIFPFIFHLLITPSLWFLEKCNFRSSKLIAWYFSWMFPTFHFTSVSDLSFLITVIMVVCSFQNS